MRPGHPTELRSQPGVMLDYQSPNATIEPRPVNWMRWISIGEVSLMVTLWFLGTSDLRSRWHLGDDDVALCVVPAIVLIFVVPVLIVWIYTASCCLPRVHAEGMMGQVLAAITAACILSCFFRLW